MSDLLIRQQLQPVGSLESYISWVSQISPLSEAEERELAENYRKTGCVIAARKMVLPHLRYVVYVAKGYVGYGLALADLVQEGNIGLMEAVKRFDPDKGARLATFSMYWIKSKIHDYITKNWRIVKSVTTKPMLKLFFKLRSSLQNNNKQYLTDVEAEMIAKTHNVRIEDVRESEYRILSSDCRYAGDEPVENEPSSITCLAAEAKYSPDVMVESHQTRSITLDALRRAMTKLDERSREIILARWLAGEKKSKLKDLAALYHVSVERVRQIEKQALQVLSEEISDLIPGDLKEFLLQGEN